MLAAGILLYPRLTFLVTPTVATRSDGQWVFVCPLDGPDAHYLQAASDFDGEPAQAEHCPALQLAQLLARR